ncbi:MAG TPA: polymer-forming cytoskeletal protein [Tepidisphaeraceae bacterium]|jgi:cytoskeletal protein CcmA (bactofilin family)
MADNNNEFPTTIGPDATFKGELTFEKGLRLQGKFEGRIHTAGRLHIAKEARLQADVEAGSIIVEGEVKGNFSASDKVELKNTARYEGDLQASKLVVDEGASLIGHIQVGPEAAKRTGGPSVAANRPVPPVVHNPNSQQNQPK